MKLEGSCHCKAVRFEVESPHPYPFNRCYCSICRKTAGGGGYAINLAASYDSLKVEGIEHTAVYHAVIDGDRSPAQRVFCKECASALWVYDPRWPDWLYPFASVIDSELPVPPESTHLMLNYKASWVKLDAAEQDQCFAEYPDESIAQWHQRLGLEK